MSMEYYKTSSLNVYLDEDFSNSSTPMAKKIFDDNENLKMVEEIKRKVQLGGNQCLQAFNSFGE